MKDDPLLEDLRRVRARRSRELARNFDRAMEESYRHQFTLGVDLVDLSSGEPRVIFKASGASGDTPKS